MYTALSWLLICHCPHGVDEDIVNDPESAIVVRKCRLCRDSLDQGYCKLKPRNKVSFNISTAYLV